MTTRYPNLANHLRKWGLTVIEQPGWQNNGRPWSDRFRPKAIICHHTASRAGSGNFASKNVVLHGRSGLPGPLCQILLGRDGRVILITGEGSNHAGTGGPISVIGRDEGNYDAWGIEAENNGVGEHWPNAQLQAYYRICAALLQLMGTSDVSRVVGHKEYTSRKIDPNGINMNSFRRQVAATLAAGPGSVGDAKAPLPRWNPANYYIGAHGMWVTWLGERLVAHGYGRFYSVGPGPNFTETDRKAVAAFQRAQGWSGSDADGFPGPETLRRLAADPKPPAKKKPKPKPLPAVSLKKVQKYASRARWAKFWPASRDVKLVKDALKAKGFITYAAWQRSLGYRGADADGVPGKSSLQRLGRGRFRVVE